MDLAHRLPTSHLTPSPASPPLPTASPEDWWEDESCLSRSSLPGLFFCLIGVLLVTINSFLSLLQAALICCHREESNVQFHSHCAINHRLWCQLLIVCFFSYCLFPLLNSSLWLDTEMAFEAFSSLSSIFPLEEQEKLQQRTLQDKML